MREGTAAATAGDPLDGARVMGLHIAAKPAFTSETPDRTVRNSLRAAHEVSSSG
jgi:hypothetical protein